MPTESNGASFRYVFSLPFTIHWSGPYDPIRGLQGQLSRSLSWIETWMASWVPGPTIGVLTPKPWPSAVRMMAESALLTHPCPEFPCPTPSAVSHGLFAGVVGLLESRR